LDDLLHTFAQIALRLVLDVGRRDAVSTRALEAFEDFVTLAAQGQNGNRVGHALNLGIGPIPFLWRLRHNTG